jgi:2-dehydropantoate 2-reductase
VISLQNGIGNATVLRRNLPACVVLAGIVSFNVVALGEGVFQQGTSGPLIVERSDDPRAQDTVRALRASGLEVETPAEIESHQWAKLMMNLGNAVSALSDAPTRDLILTPGHRRTLAALIGEALRVLEAAGVRPGKLRGVPVSWLVAALSLPTPLVKLVARAQLRVSPEARSSMWEDLSRGRATEIDYLNGEIVRVAERGGTDAPLNRRLVALVHEVEARGGGSPALGPEELWAALRAG